MQKDEHIPYIDNTKEIMDMSLRDLLIEQRTDTKWIIKSLQAVCTDVKGIETRVLLLERNDTKQDTKGNANRDIFTFTIAILALLLSGISTMWNILRF